LNDFPVVTAVRTGRANCLISVTSRAKPPASSPNRLRRTNARHWIARAGSSQYTCQSNWIGFDGGSSIAEGRSDRLHQTLSLKRIHSGKKGEIVEVFRSAVEDTERRQRFQFLGNDRLLWI
jgi:hypothetical protein